MLSLNGLGLRAALVAAGCAVCVQNSAFAELPDNSGAFGAKDCEGGLKLFPDDRARVDPDLLPLLNQLTSPAKVDVGQSSSSPLAAARERFLAGFLEREAAAPPPTEGVVRRERSVPGWGGAPSVRVLEYRPDVESSDARPILIDIHGGSYVLGFPEANDHRSRWLAKSLDAIVVSVDYRLAPEHPFPAALHDSYAVLKWINLNAESLGADVDRLAVMGDSAGGGIAASLAQFARDKGEFEISAQILIYPNVDDRSYTSLDPECDKDTAPVFTPAFAYYVGQDALLGEMPKYAFAARESELSDLPPAFIAVGDVDGLADQSIDYAQRLSRSGVAIELHVYPGAYHGFDLAPEASVTKKFHNDLRAAFGRFWNR